MCFGVFLQLVFVWC